MGRPFVERLEGDIFTCCFCSAHLALMNDLISKGFHSRSGQAYLFNAVSNCVLGRTQERMMTTGAHRVADLHCNCCNNLLGWKYSWAEEESQKYKEGKCILERAKLGNTFIPNPRSWSSLSAASSSDSGEQCV